MVCQAIYQASKYNKQHKFFHMATESTPAPPAENLHSSRVHTTVNGLRQYIEVSNECEYVRKRLKILERIENHNQAKVKVYKNSLDKYEEAKMRKQQSGQLKKEFIKRKHISEAELKEINRKNRDERRNKIQEVMKEIEEERMQDRNKIRQQSQNIAEKIQQNKERELMEKREKRNRVLQLEQESKENYRNYFQQKKDYLSQKTHMELSQLEDLKKQKSNQIKQMNKIELSILDKQSEVNNQYNTVRMRLAEIYGIDPKNNKTSVSLHAAVQEREGEKKATRTTNRASDS